MPDKSGGNAIKQNESELEKIKILVFINFIAHASLLELYSAENP